MLRSPCTLLIALAGLAPAVAMAGPNHDPREEAPDPVVIPTPTIPVPSLDEALGLVPPGTSTGPSAAQQDLEDRLSDVNLEDDFREAIALMNRASARLSDQNDPGLDTQRVQEEAIKRLDQALSKAKKRQQQQQSSSSSSRSSKPSSSQQQSPSPGQQPDQPTTEQSQQPDGQQQAGQRRQQAQTSDASESPDRQEGALGAAAAASMAAWGNLPDRIRQSLQQGSGEKFSSTYSRLTQEYYRRLAEQGRRGTGAGGGSNP
jgi:hypothetical protein